MSAPWAVRWTKPHELTGRLAVKPRGGVSCSPLAQFTDWLLTLIVDERDLITLDAITKGGFATDR